MAGLQKITNLKVVVGKLANNMIKLKDILKELSNYKFTNKAHLFPTDSGEKVLFGIVISHKKGLTPEEGEKIVKAFEKSDKDADLKYYPATKKVVGKVGVYRFFDTGLVPHPSPQLSPYLNKARIRHELDKIKKDLDISKKTVYR